MRYLVMEVHPAYAVVLDQEGRFWKAANLRYQVGDTVEEIVALRPPRKKTVLPVRPLAGAASLAACLCLVFFGYYQPNYMPYGALRIQINPDVEMTVSRTDRVLELEGLNADGEHLIDGYSHRGKDREQATEELMERAIGLGYLSDGDTVSVTVSSDDPDWQQQEQQAVQAQLEERYGESIVILLHPAEPPPEAEVVIPVGPAATQPSGSAPGSSGHTPAAGSPADDGGAGYGGAGYGPENSGATDYDPPDSGDSPYADGDTGYADRSDDDDDDDGDDDGDSGFGEPDD